MNEDTTSLPNHTTTYLLLSIPNIILLIIVEAPDRVLVVVVFVVGYEGVSGGEIKEVINKWCS